MPPPIPTPGPAPAALAEDALNAFDRVLARNQGLRAREGQRQMAERVARTFAAGELGQVEEGEEAGRAIAVIEAGTGVGKSLAYAVPAIALALSRKTRVLISTATVALQEQLVHKDLPALAAAMDEPFRFALAKGRGRYVCKLKLARQAGEEGGGEDDLFADEGGDDGSGLPPGSDAERQARLQFYGALSKSLGRDWDGDRDNLAQQPAPEAWWPVAAEASSCTGKHCPAFNGCTYFEKRRELVGAQVIVVNHDLLLASLGGRNLPALDNSLLVLDEAHHLPAVALERFACSMDLAATAWIETLGARCKRIGALMLVSEAADAPRQAAQLQQSLIDLQRLVLDVYAADFAEAREGPDGSRVRVPDSRLPEVLVEPLELVCAMADSFLAALSGVAKALRAQIRDLPDEARRLSVLYAQLGMLTPRLEQVHATAQLLLQEPVGTAAPVAKWFSLHGGGVRGPRVRAHASHVLPGGSLRAQLWSAARAVVMSSATLRAGDAFDFFLHEAGLAGDEAVTTLAVASPFDYPRQGRFVVVETRADPKDAARFTPEMVGLLMADLAEVRRGALVLFTSREQMRQAVAALPAALRALVLVQGELPRTVLLERHRAAVAAGGPSIVFGLQSFGEGMDLPGAQCEQLFITKLPFASPDDPVGETRAAWLRSNGRDAFVELVLPATAMRLAQWAGRAIRTEDDQCSIHCYDRRLVATAFGRRLLAALPPFARWRRDTQGRMHALA
ncbi:ATP-dependent DNA helicase DinG [Pseudorhodoferax sp. Leaf265]|uniref:ATP-dependent DNA helicase DinG n=1 Tax=Pseudorhodoferax sp. Leaf265 TaxID=1736315 RepID=UPI000A74BCB7|nr:ATP-dependent DNA helicase DinG [Pseudorhodoferax sp. Leaf265]